MPCGSGESNDGAGVVVGMVVGLKDEALLGGDCG